MRTILITLSLSCQHSCQFWEFILISCEIQDHLGFSLDFFSKAIGKTLRFLKASFGILAELGIFLVAIFGETTVFAGV